MLPSCELLKQSDGTSKGELQFVVCSLLLSVLLLLRIVFHHYRSAFDFSSKGFASNIITDALEVEQ